MGRIIAAILAIALVAAWWVTRPQTVAARDLPEHEPDATAGERWFWAGGCGSCHAVEGAKGEDKLRLGGGLALESPWGTFYAPNISPHPEDGIGEWSMAEFVTAMQHGVSPRGRHYYPAFPYTSYARMRTEDVMDLKAFIDTLPAVEGRAPDHDLGFPWNVRRGIGAWKRLYLDPAPVAALDGGAQNERGRYLVEGAGHCGECHSPRDRFGGIERERWLAGAPDLEGEGRVPNITPGGPNVGDWSLKALAYYFQSGFTPEFDTVGGSMVSVQDNLAQLDGEDREAIAAYLKALPARE